MNVEAHRLSSEVAVVTGAGRGLGRAIAERLSAEGAAVAVLDIREREANETVDALRSAGGRAMAIVADLGVGEEVDRALDDIESGLGPLTIGVNNAGICPTAPFLEVTEDDFHAAFGVNVFGTLRVGQRLAQRMVPRGTGSIVNVSSTSATLASSNQAAYASSKAAVEALTRAMAVELGPHGVRVNCVAPGTYLTPLAMAAIDEEAQAARAERIPLGRLGQPYELAAAVAFLVSNDASFVHGAVLHVDGGFTRSGMRDALVAQSAR